MKTSILSKSLPALAVTLGLWLIPANVAKAENDRKVFREAAGKYEGRFRATLRSQFLLLPIRFVSKGHIRVPAGKGMAYVNLVPNDMRLTPPQGESTRIQIRVRKAEVRQGGNMVLYRGVNKIPARLSPNFGEVRGPFVGRVNLREKPPVLKTHTRMKNATTAVFGPFEGKKKD